jgi:hypothetical protein
VVEVMNSEGSLLKRNPSTMEDEYGSAVTRSPFWRLPRELRDEIYKYAAWNKSFELLRCNKQVHEECKEVWPKVTGFQSFTYLRTVGSGCERALKRYKYFDFSVLGEANIKVTMDLGPSSCMDRLVRFAKVVEVLVQKFQKVDTVRWKLTVAGLCWDPWQSPGGMRFVDMLKTMVDTGSVSLDRLIKFYGLHDMGVCKCAPCCRQLRIVKDGRESQWTTVGERVSGSDLKMKCLSERKKWACLLIV